jgi:hypothetical protein
MAAAIGAPAFRDVPASVGQHGLHRGRFAMIPATTGESRPGVRVRASAKAQRRGKMHA